MRIFRALPNSRKGVFGALILAPMLYAAFVLLAPTPAWAAFACHIESCEVDDTTCHFEQGVGYCCEVCDNYICDDGTTFQRCRIECGVQC